MQSKYYNTNTFIDATKFLDEEDLNFIKEYKKVTGKNYNKKKAWQLLQIQQKKDLELVMKAKKGDAEARNYLFLKHILALKQLLDKNFNFEPIEFNDRLHDCFFLFTTIIHKFDPKKNDSFLRFVKMSLPQKMINLLKRDSKHQKYSFENVDKYISDSDKFDINPTLKIPKAFMHFDKEYELSEITD